jgi:L-alanine-DL-glutamate epimerase-like enolase superfamily enzyme
MARQAGMTIVPHNTQTGLTGAYILQFASCIPNIGKQMEYPWRKPENQPSWYSPHPQIRQGFIEVPTGPGLGMEIDPVYLAKAQKVEGC